MLPSQFWLRETQPRILFKLNLEALGFAEMQYQISAESDIRQTGLRAYLLTAQWGEL